MNVHDLFGFGENLWSPLVLALLHSIWQASLAVVLLALGLRLVRIQHAGARAALCGLAQAGVLVAFLFTWAILSAPSQKIIPTRAIPVEDHISIVNKASPELSSTELTMTRWAETLPLSRAPASQNWPRLIAFAWIAGAIFMVLRMAHDLAAGWTLVRGGTDGSDVLIREVNRLRDQFGLRLPIRVVVSERIQTPAIFGVLRPILLFPAAPIGLPPEQLEAILAHELAHIKRRDWLWHFIGRLIEAVLFYNPGVWWLGRLARREREAAADALAVGITREPAVFATALAEWAGRSQRSAKAALAWDGDSGGLRERVLRVLKPAHQPRVRFSPVGMGVAILVALVILAGLRGGAERAVAMAKELLSPEERIARIEEAKVAVEENEVVKPEQVTIAGHVRTADGVPLKETGRRGYGKVTAEQGNSTYMKSVGPSGEFTWEMQRESDEVTITAEWPGYAPTVIGPMPITFADDLEIILDGGFRGRVELLDPFGDRIREGNVKATLSEPANSDPRLLERTMDGLFALKHGVTHPYDITVLAPGYERQEFERIKLTADGTASLELTPTEPATGIVIDKDGKPLANAEIRLHGEYLITDSSRASMTWGFQGAPLLDTTDSEGRFALKSLRSEVTTDVYCAHKGVGTALFVVKPGQENIEIQLAPERMLRGEVLGNLSTLPKSQGRDATPFIGYNFSYVDQIQGVPDGMGISYADTVKVVPDPASGDPPRRGTFEIRSVYDSGSLPRGTFTFNAGGAKHVVEPFDGIKHVTIDLSKPYSRPYRDVIIRFVPPHKNDPPARGRVRIWIVIREEGAEDRWERQFHVPVEGGQIQFPAPISARVSLENSGLIGYWFNEEQLGHVEYPRQNVRAPGFLVPKGEGPVEKEIRVKPAGAIRVQMTSVPDSLPIPADLLNIRVECWRIGDHGGERPEELSEHYWYRKNDGDLLITPVPLKGIYELRTVLGGVTVISSRDIAVTPANPLPELTFKLPKLNSRTVLVVGANGRPVEKARVEINRSYPQSMKSTTSWTDEQGKVTFDMLEAEALGEYRVRVIDERYRPMSAKKDLRSKKTVLTINAGDGNPSG